MKRGPSNTTGLCAINSAWSRARSRDGAGASDAPKRINRYSGKVSLIA